MKRLILLLVFVPQALIGAALSQPQTSQTAGHEKHAQGQDKQIGPVIAPASEKQPHDEAKKKENATKWYQDPVLVGLIVNALLMVATIAIACATIKQGRATERSTRAIEQQIEVSHRTDRGWVSFWPESPKEGWVDRRSDRSVPIEHAVRIHIRTHGATAVHLDRLAFRFVVAGAKEGTHPATPDLPEEPDYSLAEASNIRTGMFFPPQMEFTTAATLENVPSINAILSEVTNKTKFLCAFGMVTYFDAFGKSRESRTCYIWAPGGEDGTVGESGELKPRSPGFVYGGTDAYNRWT